MVYADGVCGQGLHQRRIALALGGVNERISFGQLVCNSWLAVSIVLLILVVETERGCTFHIILGPVLVEELGAHRRDGVNSIDSSNRVAGQESRTRQSFGKHFGQ